MHLDRNNALLSHPSLSYERAKPIYCPVKPYFGLVKLINVSNDLSRTQRPEELRWPSPEEKEDRLIRLMSGQIDINDLLNQKLDHINLMSDLKRHPKREVSNRARSGKDPSTLGLIVFSST